MTRALPSQPSPKFLSYEMFSTAIQASEPYSPVVNIQTKNSTKEKIKTIKVKPPSRPSYAEMIDEAIFEKYIKRKGASLIAIKKYLVDKYSVDMKKLANRKRICKYIRDSVGNDGHLKQMTGHGAQGSFMLTNIGRRKYEIRKAMKSQSENIVKPVATTKIKKAEPAVTRMRVK